MERLGWAIRQLPDREGSGRAERSLARYKVAISVATSFVVLIVGAMA
jgi:hypothetical protein